MLWRTSRLSTRRSASKPPNLGWPPLADPDHGTDHRGPWTRRGHGGAGPRERHLVGSLQAPFSFRQIDPDSTRDVIPFGDDVRPQLNKEGPAWASFVETPRGDPEALAPSGFTAAVGFVAERGEEPDQEVTMQFVKYLALCKHRRGRQHRSRAGTAQRSWVNPPWTSPTMRWMSIFTQERSSPTYLRCGIGHRAIEPG